MIRWLLPAALAGMLFTGAARGHVAEFEDHRHEPGQTYTAVGLAEGQVRVLYTVPGSDLLSLVGIDDPGLVDSVVADGFIVENAGAECRLGRVETVEYSAIAAWQFELDYACDGALDYIRVHYELFADDPAHRNYTEVVLGAHVLQLVLGPDPRRVEVPAAHLAWERGPSWRVPGVMPALPGKKPSLYRYFESGFLHVLEGYDHLAFVIGLVLVLTSWIALAWTITAFTIAHSVTLGISAGGAWTPEPAIIEPLIALSIAYIGAENLWLLWRQRNVASGHGLPGATRRWPIAFGFGLAHGFGFSYMLRDLGLPEGEFLISLALFNIGVEVGQLSVVLLPFLGLSLLRGREDIARPVRIGGSIGVAMLGLWWLLERM